MYGVVDVTCMKYGVCAFEWLDNDEVRMYFFKKNTSVKINTTET